MKKTVLAFLLFLFSLPLWAADKEGGIIGTGIVGQITGLSEFEVSGMQFEIGSQFELVGVDSFNDLKMGMTLAIKAERDGDDWNATQIRRILVMVGPVTAPSEVMGIPVFGDVPDSGRVSIDGFWSEEGIVATRIDKAMSADDEVTGPLDQLRRIGNLLSPEGTPIQFDEDGMYTLTGEYLDGQFSVRDVQKGIFPGRQPNLLMAEGFLSAQDQNNEYKLIGVDARSADLPTGGIDLTKRATYCSFNGRMDFTLGEVAAGDRETVTSLCANVTGW